MICLVTGSAGMKHDASRHGRVSITHYTRLNQSRGLQYSTQYCYCQDYPHSELDDDSRSNLLFLFQRRTSPWPPGSPPPPPAMTRPASTAPARPGPGCTEARRRHRGATGTRTSMGSRATRAAGAAGARGGRHTASTPGLRASQWTCPPPTLDWGRIRSVQHLIDVTICCSLQLWGRHDVWF